MRSGLIAQKVGMSRMFAEDGTHLPVTVLRVESCQVIACRTEDSHGYSAVQLGAGTAKANRVNRAQRGHYAKAKVEPKRKMAEFRVTPDAMLDVGAELGAAHFVAGQYVDVSGTSIGKGFAGAMKRHNFSGLRATHGVSVSHRSLGSTGQCQDPGKVFKGKKMAGHMGHKQITVQNLQIVESDDERGVLLVRGAVPGPKGGWVLVRDAIKMDLPDGVPFPAGLKSAAPAAADEPEAESAEDAPAGDAASETPAADPVVDEAPAAGEAEDVAGEAEDAAGEAEDVAGGAEDAAEGTKDAAEDAADEAKE